MSETTADAEGTVVRKAFFKVDGAWIADFALQRVDERAWDRALTFLTETLDGMSTDDAISILKGEATLAGRSDGPRGIYLRRLPKDGPTMKARQARMDFMYGDLFRYGDKIWQPYAIVSGWCKDDYQWALTHRGHYKIFNVIDDKLNGALRSLYYADNPSQDMLVRIPVRWVGEFLVGDVLCRRLVDPPPFWIRVSTNDPVQFIERMNLFKLRLVGATLDKVGNSYEVRDMKAKDVETLETVSQVSEELEKALPEEGFADKAERDMVIQEQQRLWDTLLKATADYLEKPVPDEHYAELRDMEKAFEKGVDTLHRYISDTEWKEVDRLRFAFTTAAEKILGNKVREQADKVGGWIEIPLITDDGKPWDKQKTLRVPRNPFLRWAMRDNFNFEDYGIDVPWAWVAGSGWKMANDDPNHTDWMLGAGIPLEEAYDRSRADKEVTLGQIVRNSSIHHRHALVKEYTAREFTVLAGDPRRTTCYGPVVHPGPGERVPPGSIAIVPNAGPDYQLAMETANMETPDHKRGLIICETGGKLAHLAVVGREYKCVVLMLPNALKLFQPPRDVWVDLREGRIEPIVY